MNYREAWANGEIEAGTLVDRIEELESVCIAHERNREAVTSSSANVDAATQRYIDSLERELAALKAQPSGVIMPERRKPGRMLEDVYTEAWNDCLDEVARLNQPASAGDERADFEAFAKRRGLSTVKYTKGMYVCNNTMWAEIAWVKARAALSVNHSEQVLVPRVATPEMKAAIWAELDRQGFDSDLVETQSLYFAGVAAAPSAGSQGGDV